MKLYCLKCKTHTDTLKPEVQEPNLMIGTCSNCGRKKCQFVHKVVQKGGDATDVKLNEQSYKDADKRADNIDGYVLDKELSGQRRAVYHNPETKETRIAHRGTQVKSINDTKDLIDDLKVVAGVSNAKNSKTIRDAQNTTDAAKAKYGDNIKHTGHSWGAKVAETLAEKNQDKVETYNKASSPLQKDAKNKNQIDHIKVGDLVSVSALIKGKNKIKVSLPKLANAHSLKNFS